MRTVLPLLRRVTGIVLLLLAAWPAAARSVAPKLIDKGTIPALTEIKGELPDSPLEQHRFHFENPRGTVGAVTISLDATFSCELLVKGPKGEKNALGKSARLVLDEPGGIVITVAPGRGERGGKFTLKVSGQWQCGGVGGLTCPNGTHCDIKATYPDAMGACEPGSPR